MTGTDRLSIYPLTGGFGFFFIPFLSFFLIFFQISVLLILSYLCIFSSSFFLPFFKFYFILFSFIPPFFLCLSSTLYHLSMRILVMSIDSNFVFVFIA